MYSVMWNCEVVSVFNLVEKLLKNIDLKDFFYISNGNNCVFKDRMKF